MGNCVRYRNCAFVLLWGVVDIGRVRRGVYFRPWSQKNRVIVQARAESYSFHHIIRLKRYYSQRLAVVVATFMSATGPNLPEAPRIYTGEEGPFCQDGATSGDSSEILPVSYDRSALSAESAQ